MRPVQDSIREYTRGIIGGLMFSLPLLYTMEVWWAGMLLSSGRLLLLLAFTMCLLLGYNVYAGVRPNETWVGVVIDSVEEMGLALVVSGLALWLLGRIVPGDPLGEIVGKVVIEAMLVAIGISIGTAQVTNADLDEDSDDSPGVKPRDIWGVMTVSLCGAVVFATNIVVTDEVVALALESGPLRLLLMAIVSLILSWTIIHYSDLLEIKGEGKKIGWSHSLFGTMLAYSMALIGSSIILYLLGRFEGVDFFFCVAMIVVVSSASCLGASAGKLVIR